MKTRFDTSADKSIRQRSRWTPERVPLLATTAALGAAVLLSMPGFGESGGKVLAPARETAGVTRSDAETPAQHAIEVARMVLEVSETSFESHNALAAALSRRARETADSAWYDRSDEALARSLELMPGNFPAECQRVWNQLGRHEFERALVGARALNARAKDDVFVYGLLVDANVELGDYAAAEEAAQWMLNLRPGTPAATTRVSYLRELFGDIDGAVQAMTMAYHSTRPTDVEDRAWMLTHLAHLEVERGKASLAVTLADEALALFPGYHYALAERARAYLLQGNNRAATQDLRRRFEVSPHPENGFELACALATAGEEDEARALFEAFEEAALAESQNDDNANLQLVEYWLERTEDPARWKQALELTTARCTKRRDVLTLEHHAWALHRNGDDAAAQDVIAKALEVGTVSARLRQRAGAIAAALGDVEAARREMQVAYEQSPRSTAGRAAQAWLRADLRSEQSD